MLDNKSNLLNVVICLLVFEGINIIVFSIPYLAIFNPSSFFKSFYATCTKYSLFFKLLSNFPNTVYDVCIGGTPAS